MDNVALKEIMAVQVKKLYAMGIVDASFIGLDSTPVAANTKQNNPKSFTKDKFNPEKQPKADPDCAVGAQRRKRGEPQHTGSYLRSGCCADRRSARLSLLPRIQIIPARRLKCPLIWLFSLGFPPGLLFMRFFSLPGNPRFFSLFALLF